MKEKYALEELKKRCFKKNWSNLPLYARAVTFPVSVRIVRFLSSSAVTPNHVTLVSLGAAVLAAVFFSRGDAASLLAGAFLLEAYYVLDCVDGQLARVKGACSPEGAFLDYILNYIVHPAVFFSLDAGGYAEHFNPVFIAAGIFAAWGVVLGYALSDCRHGTHMRMVLSAEKPAFSAEKKESAAGKAPLSKKIFMGMHKISTYPSIMNIITGAAVLSFLSGTRVFADIALVVFAVNIPLVFAVRLFDVIAAGKIGKEYAFIEREIRKKRGVS